MVKKTLNGLKPMIVKYEPEILMSMGIAGLVFSTIWGIKATFRASKVIEEYKSSKNIDKITPKEFIKLTWKLYLPVIASTAVSIPCVITGNRVSSKRYAALATAYTVSNAALQEYKDKTLEVVGEKKAQQIQEAVSKDKIEATYDGKNQIILTGNGDNLFFEPISGRYFKTNWNNISKAANELNAEAISNMDGQVRLNDWFEKLGLEDTNMGDELGWDIRNGPKSLLKISISSHLTKDNIPCGAIEYQNMPIKLNESSY